MSDLNDHPFAIFMADESYIGPGERAWLAWIKKAERIIGHDLDGDQERDGFSLDVAHDVFSAGATPAEYADDIKTELLNREARRLLKGE